MDNPETLATLGIQDTGQRQRKQEKNTTQKTKMMSSTDPTKTIRGEPRGSRKLSSS